MASQLPEPPPNVPRIAEVQSPATGHYVVLVRMPTQLAAKFPDKPWGTSIADIGLAKQDSDRFQGYTLVDIEPLKGSPDLYWIFQKLDGPVWTTKAVGQDSLVPAKYRRLITTTETKQEVTPDTEPSAIVAPLVKSVVQQQEDTGKALKIETSETINTNATPLQGERFAPDGTVLAVSESLVDEGDAADKGVNVATSEIDPTGDGKAVKQTQTAKKRSTGNSTVDGWPTKQKKSVGVPNLTPQKYRGQVIETSTLTQHTLADSEVDNIPDPATPTGNQTTITHEKVNDWRYQKEIVTEVIDENANALMGQVAYEQRQIADVDEQLVPEYTLVDDLPVRTPADSGPLIISSQVSPIGNGKSVKETVSVGSWVEHTGSKWDAKLGVQQTFTEQFVDAASANFSAPNTSYEIINEHRLNKVVSVAPADALNNYLLSYPVRFDLDLPRVLKSVRVEWEESFSVGTQAATFAGSASGTSTNLTASVPDSASSSAAITGKLFIEYEDFATANLFAERVECYLYAPSLQVTRSAILARLTAKLGTTVNMWPVFKPRSDTITVSGQSLNVSVDVDASVHCSQSENNKTQTTSTSQSGRGATGHQIDSVQLPPCVHPAIAVQGTTYKQRKVYAMASTTVGLRSTGIARSALTASGIAYGRISPTVIPACSGPTSIPQSGLYLMDMTVGDTEYTGWFRILAQVFDASNLA